MNEDSRTLIKTYTTQELYERYPNAEFLAPFDLSDFHHETLAHAHRKKSKQKFQEDVNEKQLHKEPKEDSFLVKKSIALQEKHYDNEKIAVCEKPRRNSIKSEDCVMTREAKRERDNARKRVSKAVNRQKLLEKNKDSRDVNRENIILQRSEKTKVYNLAYRQERREKSRAYHAANREKINARKRTQRALKKASLPISS